KAQLSKGGNRRVGSENIGMRRPGRHDHTVESLGEEAAFAPRPLRDADAPAELLGADNRRGAIGERALGHAAIENSRDLWRNAEAMRIPERTKMARHPVLLGKRQGLPDDLPL